MDKFHIKGHVEKKCILASPDCVYHPDTPNNKEIFGDVNLEVLTIIDCIFISKWLDFRYVSNPLGKLT